MSLTIKKNNILGEKMYISTLPRGGKCYIIPKYGFKKSEAVMSFSYGSADLKFILGGKKKASPMGTAHFLEHKMFQKKDGDYFTDFFSSGASVNAFTDFNKTAYYFLAGDSFYTNLKRLAQMVSDGYFTEESVEREKGIIGQEIAMYDDDPGWVVYYNMLERLYNVHPLRNSIAGTKKSIEMITPELLYDAYNAFYVPQNMNVVVCGNVEPESVIETVEKNLSKEFLDRKKCPRAKYREKPEIKRNYVLQDMNLGSPMFNLGFKHNPEGNGIKRIYAMKMFLDILAGQSSYLFGRLQNTGYCEESLGLQYIWGRGLSLSVIMGRSREPKPVANAIVREIERIKERGIDEEHFDRIKRKHMGRFIRGFNSVDAVCMAQTELSALGGDLFDSFEAIRNMEKDYLEDLVFDFDKVGAVLSVVK